MKERNRRSIIKALTWRFSATIATIILVYAITRDLKISFGIGFIEVFLKLFLYYLHERIWNNIKWGRRITND
jgi:uncharacterized membrane protein